MIKNKKISFDFDGTLDNHFDGTLNPYANDIRDMLLQLSPDNDIHIITKRYSAEYINGPVEHIVVFALAKELGISIHNVHFTNRELKIAKIRQNNIDIHFDDDQYELSIYKSLCKVINVATPNWRKEIPND